MYIIEEIDPDTGTVIQTIATATNAIIGRAAYDAACAILQTQELELLLNP